MKTLTVQRNLLNLLEDLTAEKYAYLPSTNKKKVSVTVEGLITILAHALNMQEEKLLLLSDRVKELEEESLTTVHVDDPDDRFPSDIPT